MKKYLFAYLLFGLASLSGPTLKAQQGRAQPDTLRGSVYAEDDGSPLAGAQVYWLNSSIGALADSLGRFQLPVLRPKVPLVVTFAGYVSDTIAVSGDNVRVRLLPMETETVDVHARRNPTEVSRFDTKKVEELGTDELYKAACCNLNESFENNTSTDAQWSDAVTGTRDIRMLGMDGPWTQLTTEAQRYPRGLQRTGALGYIPGAWVQSLSVSKGPGSVVQGHESAAGTINMNWKPPKSDERLYLNFYGNNMGRVEANAVNASPVGKKANMANFVHYSQLQQDNDQNSDYFLDVPRYQQYNLASRWDFIPAKNWIGHAGVQHYQEWKQAGQFALPPDQQIVPTGEQPEDWRYRAELNTQLTQGYLKMGHMFPGQPWKSVATQIDLGHWQKSGTLGVPATGLRALSLRQQQAHANFIYSSILSDTRHLFTVGLDVLHDDNLQAVDSLEIARTEFATGGYGEYTWKPHENFSAVAGMRLDWHNLFGWQPSPRLHLRYMLAEDWVFRLNGGRSWHTPDPIATNVGALISNRRVAISPLMMQNPEANWNFGGSITRHFTFSGNRAGYLSVDGYRSVFTRQLVMDRDLAADLVYFDMQGANGFANSLQVEFSAEVLPGLDLRLAWKGYDVRQETAGEVQAVALIPPHRALANVGWHVGVFAFDLTVQWFGPQRLPALVEGARTTAPDYTFMLGQATWQPKKANWALYVGAENLLNFQQPGLIQQADNWVAPTFDASIVWGPPVGRMIYVGWRWSLFAPKKGKSSLPAGEDHRQHESPTQSK